MKSAGKVDVCVIGAGAAGLFCAAQAGQMGRSVLILDHAKKPAEKVRISGGGRCNFTNMQTAPSRFLSDNPHFAKSSLARYTPSDFMDLMSRHGLTWHEKTLGQLFCDQKSGAVIQMLLDEAEAAGVELRLQTPVRDVEKTPEGFRISTDAGAAMARKLVIATGGLSIPKMGATNFAYELAKRFGHRIVPPRPGLVPFTFDGEMKEAFSSLAGVASPVRARCEGASFAEAMLFTHRGLSGPAMLQLSSYWRDGEAIEINLLPDRDALNTLKAQKETHPKQMVATATETLFPKRLSEKLGDWNMVQTDVLSKKLAETSHTELEALVSGLQHWQLIPAGTEGYRTAEVTVGGVDTRDLSSKTMESRHVEGLYFIGECVDVTGWLGGYNFQWAWASGWAAAQAI